MSDIRPNNPIRVLQVLHVLDRGGAEAMIMNLYRNIDRSRIQFDFLVHSDKRGLYEDEIEALGGRIYRIQSFKGYNLLSYYRECLKFFKAHPEIKIVHGHLGSCAAYYLKAAKAFNIYTIAHSHSASRKITLYNLTYRLFAYPTRWVADKLFGCSTEAGILRYGRRAVNSIRYSNFNNAVDTTLFKFNQNQRDSLRQEFGFNKETLVFGTVGRITMQKNPLRIYSIFKQILSHEPNAVCLWVGTGEMENEIKGLIAQDQLEQKIIMTGVRSDIPAVLSALDCMIFPSLWEGLPVSVVESQMANLPCILSTTISRETEFSDLLLWKDLSDDDREWADDAICMAREYHNSREKYSFSPDKSGYDIVATAKNLTEFYEQHAK